MFNPGQLVTSDRTYIGSVNRLIAGVSQLLSKKYLQVSISTATMVGNNPQHEERMIACGPTQR